MTPEVNIDFDYFSRHSRGGGWIFTFFFEFLRKLICIPSGGSSTFQFGTELFILKTALSMPAARLHEVHVVIKFIKNVHTK
jgi:hypothetical protein